tara:strand:+ start:919 stop:1062 length:144 start_codon:yes stop_codon:yes gene_type:complete
MTLVFSVKPKARVLPQQKYKYKFNSIKRIQMGIKNSGNKRIGCGCGK